MNHVILGLCVILGATSLAEAKLNPMTVKEISLMLRSGYSVEMVEKDVAGRYFLGAIDVAEEKALTEVGMTPAFLERLKSGAYAVPADDVEAVRRELEAKAQRRAAQQEEAKKFNSLYQDQLARSRASAVPTPGVGPNVIAAMVRGDLATSRNGVLTAYNDQALERKKVIALYFAAQWCPSCRKFTPELIEYYKRTVAAHPEFELIFVSNDRSGPAMEKYMRDAQMPWPAVIHETIAEKRELLRYAGSGIPCLVLVDGSGKVLSDSYDGKTYLGPNRVLADLNRILGVTTPGAVAANP